MSQELLYTSAPRGLKPGSRGFCTVVCTRDMPPALAAGLESLSAYRHLFPPGERNAGRNPVAWSHVRLSAGGKSYNVLSRVSDFGLDYSQRGNKLAHHVVLEPCELPAGGPAWLLAQSGFMSVSWDGNPRLLAQGRVPRNGSSPPSACRAWRDLAGDAGWAGVLAEAFLANPDRPAYIVFEPGTEMLPLVAEAIALLPAERRWDVTFSTYFTNLAPGVVCNWRCVFADSPEFEQARRLAPALQINLCGRLPAATGGELVKWARRGPDAPAGRGTAGRRLADADDWALRDAAVEGPAGGSAAPGAAEQDAQAYALQGGATVPRGMPPPPPANRRRRLEELNEQEARRIEKARKRQMATAAIVLFVVLAAGIGAWAFREPLFGPRPDGRAIAADEGKTAAGSRRKKDSGNEETQSRRKGDKASRPPGDGEEQNGKRSGSEHARATGDSDKPAKSDEQATAEKSAQPDKPEKGAATQEHAQAADAAGPDDATEDKPPQDKEPLAIRYAGRRLQPRAGLYFLDPAPGGALELTTPGAEGPKWELILPDADARGVRVDSPAAARPFVQKLIGPNTEGAGGLVTLYSLREKDRHPDHSAGTVIEFHPGSDAGALVDRIRWAALAVETGPDAELIVLHELVPLPEPRRLEKGRVAWRIEAWGGVAPQLVIERIALDVLLDGSRLPLVFESKGDDDGNRARLVCTTESQRLLRKRQDERQWSDDLPVPELQATLKPKTDEKGRKFVELVASVPPLGTERLDDELSRAGGRLSQQVAASGLKLKLEAAVPSAAPETIRTALKKVDEALADADDPEQRQALQTLQTELRRLDGRVRLAATSRQRLNAAEIVGARVFYRIEGRNEKIDLINCEHENSRPAEKGALRSAQ